MNATHGGVLSAWSRLEDVGAALMTGELETP